MGELLETRRDIGLLNRAIREQWPTAPEMKKQAVENLMKLVQHPDPAIALVAIDQLRKIDAHNFKMATAALPSLHLHQHQHGQAEEDLTFDERKRRLIAGVETLDSAGGD